MRRREQRALASAERQRQRWATPRVSPNKERDAAILVRYYAFDRPSLDVIGREFGLTRERIRQVVKTYGYGMRPNRSALPALPEFHLCPICDVGYEVGTYAAHAREHRTAYSSERDRAFAEAVKASPDRTVRAIANEFGIGYSSAQMILYRHGIYRRGQRAKTMERNEAFIRAYLDEPDKAIGEIASQFNINVSYATHLLRQWRLQQGVDQPGESE